MPSPPMGVQLTNPAEWVARYGDSLLRFACSRVADRGLAEDLVQDTFLAAYRHRAQFDGKSAFGSWLAAILRRKIIDHYRRVGRSPDLDANGTLALEAAFTSQGKWTSSCTKWRTTPRELAENAEFWAVFQTCLANLPAHLAHAFHLREVALAPLEEASRRAGVTPQNLAVRLHRARLLLRSCLEQKWFRDAKGRDL